jgi:hypothetical protein
VYPRNIVVGSSVSGSLHARYDGLAGNVWCMNEDETVDDARL